MIEKGGRQATEQVEIKDGMTTPQDHSGAVKSAALCPPKRHPEGGG